MNPNIRINVFNEIKKIKDLKPGDFNNDVSKWLTAMDATRIAINQKIPNAYNQIQFTMDIFDGAAKTPCDAFTKEIVSFKNKWNLGNEKNGWY